MFLSIRNKILIAHFGMVLLVGLAIGGSGYYFITAYVNIDETRHLEFMANTLRERILAVVAQKKSTLQRILDGRESDVYIQNNNRLVLSQYLARFSKEFPVLSYVTLDGEEEAGAVNGIILEGKSDIRNSPILKEIIADPHGIIISYEQNNIGLGVPAVTLAMAKYSFFDDKLIGFIKGSVPLSSIAGVVSGSEIEKAGFSLLLDDKQTIIYAGRRPFTIGKSIEAANGGEGKDISTAPLTKGVNVRRAFILGVDSIAASAPVEGLKWSVMVVIPFAEFNAGVNKIKYATAGVLIIVLTVSGVIFTLITRNITNNITNPLKRFISFTDMIARGNYSQITGIKSKDEVGVLADLFNNMLMELEKSRNDLTKAKDYTGNIIETIASAVIVLTEDAGIIKVNKSACRMLGLSEDDLLKRRIDAIFESDTIAEILYNEIVKNGYVKDVEVVLLAEYGLKVPVIFSASVIYGSDGKTIDEIVCSAQNITQLKRMQRVRDMHLQELETANKYLKESRAQLVQAEKLVSLGQMLSGVAHEINTPVGIGITLSSTIAKDTENIKAAFDDGSLRKERLGEYIDDVAEGSSLILKSLTRTTDLIKSFKMVSADQITQERRVFKLKEYIEEILLSLQPNMKRRKHNIEIICKEDTEVDSYPGAIAQIITNLLMNSLIHAYDPGSKGTITIELSVNKDDPENGVVIRFSDDGKGMPNENVSRIYDPFFTTKRGAGGTGLGLHIVHNIVTQTLGGSIECQSELTKGTAFTIVFPVMKNEDAA
ncbi:MAG: PAS domain-containing protein [Nitrospirae bacterium]|nr:PAS domain-containing protein [Nitrospirota bacterium]